MPWPGPLVKTLLVSWATTLPLLGIPEAPLLWGCPALDEITHTPFSGEKTKTKASASPLSSVLPWPEPPLGPCSANTPVTLMTWSKGPPFSYSGISQLACLILLAAMIGSRMNMRPVWSSEKAWLLDWTVSPLTAYMRFSCCSRGGWLTVCRWGCGTLTVRVLRMNEAITVEGRVERWRERALWITGQSLLLGY